MWNEVEDSKHIWGISPVIWIAFEEEGVVVVFYFDGTSFRDNDQSLG
jgi:hypothetical protein